MPPEEIKKEDVNKFVMLIIRILSDPQMNAMYIANPQGVMRDAGISIPVIKVVLSGDGIKIRDMFAAAGFETDGKIMVHRAFF